MPPNAPQDTTGSPGPERPPASPSPAGTTVTTVTRAGGDVEVRIDRAGATTRLRGTWRRVGLRASWAAPLLALEVAVLGVLWWRLPGAFPVLAAAAIALLARHLLRGWREVRGVVSGWVELDDDGIRGPAVGADLRWDDIREVRFSGEEDRPTVTYLTADTAATVEPRDLPTERLLDSLVPTTTPLALGHPAADPREVRVESEGFHVLPARGHPVSVRWEAVVAVEVTAVEVIAAEVTGDRRLARSLDVLAEVRLPGGGRPREELVSLPLTVAADAGLVDALGRYDATLPDRIASSPVGTHELWNR
jgi:hypothetical protein